MRLFAIGDTHLPSTRGKTMDRFGWTNHPAPLAAAWDAAVHPDDFVLVVGDISWASKPIEVDGDLAWLHARPGKKVLFKGNHDYWWGDSASKLRRAIEPYSSIIGTLNGSAMLLGPYLVAGTRLWTVPEAPPMPGGEMGDGPVDLAYVEREKVRLAKAIDDAKRLERETAPGTIKRRIIATHFPPRYSNGAPTDFSRAIEAYGPDIAVYGHLHSPEGIAAGYVGKVGPTQYHLVSCDAAKFAPVCLAEA